MRQTIRVVLDSNVYVSAFSSPHGSVFPIWLAAVERRYTLLTSPFIVREVADCFRLRFGWHEARIQETLKLMVGVAKLVVPSEVIAAVKDDPDDDQILACARAGRADIIVSGDRDLGRLKSFRGIPIVRPVEFRRILGL